MAAVSASATSAVRSLISLCRKLRSPAIGGSLVAAFELMREAHRLAYVAPYTRARRQTQTLSGEDLESGDAIPQFDQE